MPALTYRRVPYNVSAMQITPESLAEAAKWTGGKTTATTSGSENLLLFPNINEPRGVAEARVGDYVVKDDNGRFSRVSSDVFETDFELLISE